MISIYVVDDDPDAIGLYVGELEGLHTAGGGYECLPVEEGQFIEALAILRDRQRLCRGDSDLTFKTLKESTGESLFDKADILLLDDDLYDFAAKNLAVDGGAVAYLARCFSECGVILGLTVMTGNYFDLTLRGDLDSFADIDIPREQLTCKGLWSESTIESHEFRPWCWATVPELLGKYRRRAEDAAANLDTRILEHLGFPRKAADALPRGTGQFLARRKIPEDATFRDFVNESGQGLQGRDRGQITDPVMLGRVAAARISKWLEHSVLPAQEVLVDAPHLVLRFPSLLKGDHEDMSTWDRTARVDIGCDGLDVKCDLIDDSRFKEDFWLSRVAWFWPVLVDNENIPEVTEPWSAQSTDFVFCEDSSSFAPASEAQSFVAEGEWRFARRSVRKLAGVEYRPLARLSE